MYVLKAVQKFRTYLNFAAMLLKLEHFFHVPGIAVNEFLEELHFLLSTSSQTATCDRLKDLFQEHSLACDDAIIQDIDKAVCESHPLHTAIGQHGPLSTVYRRKEFYKSHFCVVEPVEYILDSQQGKTFQYVPILKFLQQLLAKEDVIETILANHRYERNEAVYSSYQNGSIFRENAFLSGDDLRLLLRLYVDDFEVCNPLGTSRRTHKLCAVYWTLSNLPTSSHATMSSIFLAVLCKSNDVKEYGFSKILEPLLQDLAHLEEVGIFIPSVGNFVKGTVHVVIADNLGAHSIAGYVESFSSEYYCRFCTGKRSEIQTNEVRSGRFSLRKRESYDAHLKSAQQTGSCCFGVKNTLFGVYSPHTLLIFMFSLAIPQMSCMMFLKVLYHLSLSIVCQCFYQRSTSPLNFSMSLLLISPINGRTRQTDLMQSLAQCSARILLEAMLTRTGT